MAFWRKAGRIMSLRLLFSLSFAAFGLSLYFLVRSEESCDAVGSCPEDGGVGYQERVHISVVACGERLEETLMMLKSAVTLGTAPLTFHVFADDHLRESFHNSLREWVLAVTWRSLEYHLHPIQFPPGTETQWRTLFKTCACQRLFIPSLLTDVDATIYMDTDTLFHRPPESLWAHFRSFNDSHISGLAPEGETATANWYVRWSRHPFFPPYGVNSGVMLMNLTRMRAFGWEAVLWPLYLEYRTNITWGDQDIINIIFHDNQEKLYVFPCHWNYRPDHCMYGSTCGVAEEKGAYIVHGSRSYFHLPDKQPAFKAVYDAWKQFQIGSDVLNLVTLMESTLATAKDSEFGKTSKAVGCIRISDAFLKPLRIRSPPVK